MEQFTIFRDGTPLLTTKANGVEKRRIMGEHLVTLSFNYPVFIDFTIGDTVAVYGEVFTIQILPQPAKNLGQSGFVYNLEFHAEFYELRDVILKVLDNDNELTNPEVTYTGTANDWIDLIIQNAKLKNPEWVKGEVIESEYKTLSFQGVNCLDALATIAAEFSTEYHFTGRGIDLYKKGFDLDKEPWRNTGITLEPGQGKGLTAIERINLDTNFATRFYIKGSEKNLLGSYRNYSNRLLLPIQYGKYLSKNENLYGLKEAYVEFDDIYPYRIGEVTEVFDKFRFSDSGMDFNINTQLVDGVTVKVSFLTGNLAGFTFELLDPTGYNDVTKTFTLIKNKDEKSIDLPNDTLKPAVGDMYIIFDIYMPQTYVTEAENNLLEVALFHVEQNAQPKVSYRITCDDIFFIKNQIILTLADSIYLKYPVWNIEKTIRITYIERDINNRYRIKIEVAESLKTLKDVIARQKQRQIDRIVNNRNKEQKPAATIWKVRDNSAYCITSNGANTGYLGYSILDQLYADTLEPTGGFKQNEEGKQDYVQPVLNTGTCPINVVPNPPQTVISLNIGYELITEGYRVNISRSGAPDEVTVFWEYQYSTDMGNISRWLSGQAIVLPVGSFVETMEGSIPQTQGNVIDFQVRLKTPLPSGYNVG